MCAAVRATCGESLLSLTDNGRYAQFKRTQILTRRAQQTMQKTQTHVVGLRKNRDPILSL